MVTIEKGPVMGKAKPILIAVVALLGIIIILQNTASIQTNILFLTIIMPRAVLLFVTLLLGVVIGVFSSFWFGRKRRQAKQ